MLEDKQLILKLKTGDTEALRKIYQKYKDELFTIAMSLLGESNAAEDVLHDVLVSFARAVKKFRLYGSLKNYLVTCVLNRSRDMLRSKMYQVIEIKRIKLTDSNINTLLDEAISTEQLDLLEEALEKIPLAQREVMVLHLHGGMSLKEIAHLQKVSVNTVQGRYRYGIEKFQSILNGKVQE